MISFSLRKNVGVMRHPRLRNDEDLLVGDKTRMHAPSSDKVFAVVVLINSGGVGTRQLNTSTRRSKEHLRGRNTASMRRNTLDPNKDLEQLNVKDPPEALEKRDHRFQTSLNGASPSGSGVRRTRSKSSRRRKRTMKSSGM